MADEKKPSYILAYTKRMKQLGHDITYKEPGPRIEPSRGPELEIKPDASTFKLGEGSRK